jgi:hypothetical protein
VVIKESEVGEILVKINKAVINPVTMHPLDEEKIVRVFMNALEHDLGCDMGDIQTKVGPSEI